MKILYAQTEILSGKPAQNFARCAEIVAKAKAQSADLLIFPELVIPGKLLGDILDEDDFISDCEYYTAKLAALSDQKLSIVFGTIAFYETVFGKSFILPTGRRAKLNVACIAQNGRTNYRIKTSLSYDECRHFAAPVQYAGVTTEPIEIHNVNFAINLGNEILKLRHEVSPAAEIIVNISSTPFYYGKKDEIYQRIETKACVYAMPLIYCGGVGVANTGKNVYVLDGISAVYDQQGNVIRQSPAFEEDLVAINYENGQIKGEETENQAITEPQTEMAQLHAALIYGIRKFLSQCGLQHVVIGASGGVDSTLAAALYAEAIGPKNLLLVNMPTKFNSQTTIQIAENLAKNIGCWYTSVPIGESVELSKRQIDGLKPKNAAGEEIELKLSSFNIENVQARDRGSRVLGAIASAWNGVFTNNGNKTECTVGYATLYGDVSGFFGAIGDLWKHQVYDLCRYINEKSDHGEIVPQKVLEIVPSAELSDNQNVDQDKGDPIIYPYHDRLFAAWRERNTPLSLHTALKLYTEGHLAAELNGNKPSPLTEEFIKEKFPTAKDFCADLENWYKKYKGLSVAKRIQAPPILRVTHNPYGSEYREPAVGAYFTKAYLDLKAEVAG